MTEDNEDLHLCDGVGTVIVVPIKGDATVEEAGPVGCDFVVVFDSVD